jgi:hypothetical protein
MIQNIPLDFIYYMTDVQKSLIKPFRAIEDMYGTVLADDPSNWFTLLGCDYPPIKLRYIDKDRWEDMARAWAADAGWGEIDEDMWLNPIDAKRIKVAWQAVVDVAECATLAGKWVALQHLPSYHNEIVVGDGIRLYEGPINGGGFLIARLGDRAWLTNFKDTDKLFEFLLEKED